MIYRNFLYFIIAVAIFIVAPSSENRLFYLYEDVLILMIMIILFSQFNKNSFNKLRKSFKDETLGTFALKKEYLRRVILTASGGPFFRRNKREFSQISVKEALTHPTWSMGTKITLDSATLMNKALEIIETYYLFNLNKDQIDVVIHPQSIVHSMVEFIDSSLIAQLSWPDMRIPILYSLSFPERMFFENKGLNLSDLKKLDFYPVDTDKFRSIELAYYVLDMKKNAGAVFNAANEVATESFLKEEISFNDIFDVVETVLHDEKFYPIRSLDDVEETIRDTKNKTANYIKRRKPK